MKRLRKILLIDDDDINNFINVHVLEKVDIAEKIKVVKNGKLALDFIKERCGLEGMICPEFIILDYKMPVMDGMEFLEALHEIKFSNWDEVVILALGSHLKDDIIERFKLLGVKEITKKPLSEETVLKIYNKYWGDK